MVEFDWHAYGFVLGSGYRKNVVAGLREGPRTPKEIAGKANLRLSHTSKTLVELEKMNIVICLTPKLRKGRLYGLTDLGHNIASRIG